MASDDDDDDDDDDNNNNIVIRDYGKGTCMMIDVAIPGDRNVIQKEAEKNTVTGRNVISSRKMNSGASYPVPMQ
jgi:hypothetical protein